MTREQQIIETFVELSDTMVEDFDVVEFQHRLAEHCVALLDCAEAGLMLADAAGRLRVIASSSERTDALELLQSQAEEGPCFDCHQRGEVVSSADLAQEGDRWPLFAPTAIRMGFRSMHAVPMRVHGKTIGGLNLFRAEAGLLPDEDVLLAQGMADIAAVALLQERTVRAAHGVVKQLQGALTSRVLIEQAKGVLAERADISVNVAFARMRLYARNHNRRLSDVAHDLIDGKLDGAALPDPTSGTAPAR